jgi:hypothetical protein
MLGGSSVPRYRFASGPLRFGPLALLLVGTVAAAVTSVAATPRSTPPATTKRPSHPGTVVTAAPAVTTTSIPFEASPESSEPWSTMRNDLDVGPESVACPSTTLCVFTGQATQFAGQQQRAVSASSGPFVPDGKIAGHFIDLPQAVSEEDISGPWYVACPSTTACIMSSPDALYATASPATGPWTVQLTAPSGEQFGDVSCAGTTFCAVLLGNDILISRSPLGGAGTWTSSGLPLLADDGVGVLSCPSPQLCVAGGSSGIVGGWIEASTDPGGGAQAWSGGAIVHPAAAQHSWEYSITDVSCPTTSFCVAVAEGGPLDVSTDPAGGPTTWQPALHSFPNDGGPGITVCSSDGSCLVTGAGTFQEAQAGAPGPGFAGFPQSEVSCVTVSLCVSVVSSVGSQLGVAAINRTSEG